MIKDQEVRENFNLLKLIKIIKLYLYIIYTFSQVYSSYNLSCVLRLTKCFFTYSIKIFFQESNKIGLFYREGSILKDWRIRPKAENWNSFGCRVVYVLLRLTLNCKHCFFCTLLFKTIADQKHETWGTLNGCSLIKSNVRCVLYDF